MRTFCIANATLAFASLTLGCGDNIPLVIPPPPQVQSGGGTVLAAPEIVPIFFAGDDEIQGQIETFLTQLATSSYWAATTSEYGVGIPTIDATIVSTDAPPTTDMDLQTWITAHVPTPTNLSGWPSPNANTIYTVFLPDGVVLTAGSDTSCVTFGGYHDETTGGGLVYALLPRCATSEHPPVEGLTPALSHELIEASTDPHPETAPAFNQIDEPDLVWAFTPGSEVGDMCEYVQSAIQTLVGDFRVQRTWSNVSAAAGHDPCVPTLPGPYIRAVPILDDVTLDYGNGMAATTGVQIANGASRTVGLALLTDAPTADWNVGADDVAPAILMMPTELDLSLDKTTGNDGDLLYLTIKRVKEGTGGGSEFVVTSKLTGGETVSLWWGLATN